MFKIPAISRPVKPYKGNPGKDKLDKRHIKGDLQRMGSSDFLIKARFMICEKGKVAGFKKADTHDARAGQGHKS